MEVHTVPLLLKDLRMITGSLKNIISKSFGPKGGSAFIMSSTSQVVVTHDCSSILSALNLSHPVSKVIVDSVRSFGRTHGDGCKTVIIYIHELLSAIEQNYVHLGFGSSNDKAYSNTVLKTLNEFIHSDLLSICVEVQEFVYAQNCKENEKHCRDVESFIFNVIQNCLTGLPDEVVNHLAKIMTTLTYIAESGHSFKIFLKFIDNFILMLPNQVYINSHIRDGIFLHGNFSGQQSSVTDISCIFMLCSLEGHVDKQSTDEASLTSTNAERFLTYRAEVASTFLHCVKSAGVTCILTTEIVPYYVLQICYSLNINVLSCIDSKDLELVTFITGKLPITSIYESFTKENIINVSALECVVMSGRHFVKIVFNTHYTKCIPQSLFLCAPTDGMCQQLKMTVKKSFLVVEQCLLGSISSSFRDFVNAKSTIYSGSNTSQVSSIPSTELRKSNKDRSPIMDKKLNVNTDNFNSRWLQSILKNIVYGYGHFENVMIHFLQCHIRSDISCNKKFICRVLMNMLEAVPKALHMNSIASHSSKSRHFLYQQHKIAKTINEVMTVKTNTQVTVISLENSAVDVLNIKFEALFAAVHLVVKLLKIDAVVGVNRLVNDDTHGSQVEDGDDMG